MIIWIPGIVNIWIFVGGSDAIFYGPKTCLIEILDDAVDCILMCFGPGFVRNSATLEVAFAASIRVMVVAYCADPTLAWKP